MTRPLLCLAAYLLALLAYAHAPAVAVGWDAVAVVVGPVAGLVLLGWVLRQGKVGQ